MVSVSERKQSTKSPQEFRRNFGAFIRTKFGSKIQGIRELLVLHRFSPKIEVPSTWEKESRCQKVSKKSRKSLEKSLRARGPQSPKKVSKKFRKVSKNPFSDFFFDFSDLFRHIFRTFGARPWETFFETFSRLFETFWHRDSFSQVHGTSNLRI